MFFLFLIGFLPETTRAQTIEKTLDYYRSLQCHQADICSGFSNLVVEFLLGSPPKKISSLQKELLKTAGRAKMEMEESESFSGQEHLKMAYIQFANQSLLIFENEGLFSQWNWENEPSDSILKKSGVLLQSLKKFGQLNEQLEKDQMQFQMINKVPEARKIRGISAIIQEFIRKVENGMAISNYVNEARQTERNGLVAMAIDSMPVIHLNKQKLVNICDSFSLKIKKLPQVLNDGKLREAALGNLRQYRQEANKDWPQLIAFVQKDRQFFLLNQKMKENPNPTELEKTKFRDEVKAYNQNLKAANQFIKGIEVRRQPPESNFEAAMATFLKTSLPRLN